MVKVRPVVVITPQLPGRSGLCTIIPLSTVEPNPFQAYHHKMDSRSLPNKLRKLECWAKCDMIYTVSLERLDRIPDKDEKGKRCYLTGKATIEDLNSIELAVLNGLGLRKFIS